MGTYFNWVRVRMVKVWLVDYVHVTVLHHYTDDKPRGMNFCKEIVHFLGFMFCCLCADFR